MKTFLYIVGIIVIGLVIYSIYKKNSNQSQTIQTVTTPTINVNKPVNITAPSTTVVSKPCSSAIGC